MCNVCLDAGVGRRRLMLAGAGLLAASQFVRTASAQPVAAANTPDAALTLLTEGKARYVANQPRERDFSAKRASLAKARRLSPRYSAARIRELRRNSRSIRNRAICLWSGLPGTS